MATKMIYKVCDNCKHEELWGVEDTPLPEGCVDALLPGWWEGDVPLLSTPGIDPTNMLLCDGCVIGINSALTLRTKETRSETAD